MTAGQLLAWAAIVTAVTALVTAVGALVKVVGELRQVGSEVQDVKSLVNGNHTDLVRRLDEALAQRDEARADLAQRPQRRTD